MSETQEIESPVVDTERNGSLRPLSCAMEPETVVKQSEEEEEEEEVEENKKAAEAENEKTPKPESLEKSKSCVEDVNNSSRLENTKSREDNGSTPTTKNLERAMPAMKKPLSPFAKFRQLDRQNSASTSPSTPKSPGRDVLFKFTDPVVQNNAVQIKERLLSWCRAKTKEYENVQLDNFSTSWNNGLAFCALLHHFRPDAFDYQTLRPEDRRKNFQLAFTKADEIAGIAPLLDVEDMVMMRRPDWKCVFTYVQSIYRRFKDED